MISPLSTQQSQSTIEKATQHWTNARQLLTQGKVDEALNQFHQSIVTDQSREEVFLDFLQFLMEKRMNEPASTVAMDAYRRFPSSINVKMKVAHFFDGIKNMPMVFRPAYEAWQLSNENVELATQLVGSGESICEWGILSRIKEKLLNEYKAGNYQFTHEFPLFHVAWCDDPAINLRVIKKHVFDQTGSIVPLPPSEKYKRHERIRIGYLSADWIDHATLVLMQGMFPRHDKNKFEIFIYDHSPLALHPRRTKLKFDADHFVEISHLDNKAAAERIRQDEIDILVEVKAWTQDNQIGRAHV